MFNNNFHKNGRSLAIALLATLFWVVSGMSAWANTATTLGDVFCNAYYNMNEAGGGYANHLAFLAYTAGIICILQGIHHMRMHSENARNHPLGVPLFLLLGGTLLVMLPAISSTIVTSIYGTAADGNVVDCAAAAPAGGPGLDGMLKGFVSNIYQPAITTTQIIAILCGVVMMIRGLMKMAKYGSDAKTHSVASIAANIIFGALLMSIGDNLNMVVGSLFGSGAAPDPGTSTLAWSSQVTTALGGASAQFQAAVNAALYFVQIIGFIAFVRGWMVLKKVVEGGGNVTMAQGITHVVGGVFAINIFDFLKAMDTTFGTGLLS